MAVGSIPTAQNWAHPRRRKGYFCNGAIKVFYIICLGEFPHVWFLSGIIIFLLSYLLMFGGLYLHLSVRHISICVLMFVDFVASPLFVLCNYHLAHYNSHFSWGRGAPRNIRSLVGHKSNMTSTCSLVDISTSIEPWKIPWLIGYDMKVKLPGRGLL